MFIFVNTVSKDKTLRKSDAIQHYMWYLQCPRLNIQGCLIIAISNGILKLLWKKWHSTHRQGTGGATWQSLGTHVHVFARAIAGGAPVSAQVSLAVCCMICICFLHEYAATNWTQSCISTLIVCGVHITREKMAPDHTALHFSGTMAFVMKCQVQRQKQVQKAHEKETSTYVPELAEDCRLRH